MKLNLSRKTKLIASIVLGAIFIFSSTIFALGKTGVIDLKSFADEIVSSLGATDGTGTIRVAVNTNGLPAGAGICVQLNNGAMATTDGSSVATFSNVTPGSYVTSACGNPNCGSVGINAVAGATRSTTLNCASGGGGGDGGDGGGGGGGAEDGGQCGTTQCPSGTHCTSSIASGGGMQYNCVNNCTATSCGNGQTCVNNICQCANGNCNQPTPQTGNIRILVKDQRGNPMSGINAKLYKHYGEPDPDMYDWRNTQTTNSSSLYNLEFRNMPSGGYYLKANYQCPAGSDSSSFTQNLYAGVAPTLCEKYVNLVSTERIYAPAQGGFTRFYEVTLQDSRPEATSFVVAGEGYHKTAAGLHIDRSNSFELEFNNSFLSKQLLIDTPGIEYKTNPISIEDQNRISVVGWAYDNYDIVSPASPLNYSRQDLLSRLNYNTTLGQWVYRLDVEFVSNKFNFIGKVTDEAGELLPGVRVEVSCANCGWPSDWSSTTSAQRLTTYPTITEEYNQDISYISRTINRTAIPTYRVEYSKPGYQTESIEISQSQIGFQAIKPDGTSAWIARRDMSLKAIRGNKLKIFGRVLFEDPATGAIIPLPDRMISLTGCGDRQSATTTSAFSESFVGKTGNFAFPEVTTNESFCANPILQLNLSSSEEYTIPVGESSKELKDASYSITVGDQTFEYFEFKVLRQLIFGYRGDTFTIFGSAKDDSGNLVKDVRIESRVLNSNFKKVAMSNEVNSWPSVEPKTANYSTLPVPKLPGFNYELKATAPNGYGFIDPQADTSSGVTAQMIKDTITYSFNYSQIFFNEYYQKYVFNQDIELIRKTIPQVTLVFKDARTGEFVDIGKENILRNSIICNKESFSPARVNAHVADYAVSPTCQINIMSLDFETEEYEVMNINDHDRQILSFGLNNIFLTKKTNPEDALACQSFSKIKFCTHKFREKDVFDSSGKVAIAKYAKILSSLLTLTKTNRPPYVFITSTENISTSGDFLNQSADAPLFVAESSLRQNDYQVWVDGLFKDLGRYVWFKNGYNRDDKDLAEIYDSFSQPSGNSSPACAAFLSPGYPCFSSSANKSKEDFWSEYFKYWVFFSDKIDQMKDDAVLSKEEYQACKTALVRMDLMMRNKFPEMKRYKPVSVASTRSMSAVGSSGLGAPTIATAEAETDLEFFNNAMLAIGYEENVPTTTYATIAPLSELTLLTPAEMTQGLWLQENFDQLPVAKKYTLKIKILMSRAQNLTASAIGTVDKSLSSINAKIEEWLKKYLGAKITSTRISGRVVDQSNIPLGRYTVTTSYKTDQTDRAGRFDIRRTKSGRLTVKVKNPITGKTYVPSPSKITVADNQQLEGLTFQILRTRRNVSGRVLNNDNTPLANGKIKVKTLYEPEQTFDLDQSGKFNFKLKEDAYSFKIYDAKGHSREVASPGSFLNMSQVKIVRDTDGVIMLRW